MLMACVVSAYWKLMVIQPSCVMQVKCVAGFAAGFFFLRHLVWSSLLLPE